ncbi:helix-turn-helix domain-containing protein [Embleya sp. NPDC056575]|uniref:helix-turn-helix domain-containing protein n=1 Tax=unclassified Embleya TaxID=2699296 RepID=UPI003698DE07
MGRPERPLDPAGGPVIALARELRRLRESAGLTYRQMAEKSQEFHASSFSRAASGHGLSEPLVTEFVRVCGGGHKRAADLLRRARGHRHLVNHPRSANTMLPLNVQDAHDLLLALHTIRLSAGQPSLRVLSERIRGSGTTIVSPSTLGELLQGARFPTKKAVQALALACGASTSDLPTWGKAWANAKEARVNPNRRGYLLPHSHPPVRPARPVVPAVSDSSTGQTLQVLAARRAEEVMREQGFIPQAPYPGADHGWESVCAHCGTLCVLRLHNVLESGATCPQCYPDEHPGRSSRPTREEVLWGFERRRPDRHPTEWRPSPVLRPDLPLNPSEIEIRARTLLIGLRHGTDHAPPATAPPCGSLCADRTVTPDPTRGG